MHAKEDPEYRGENKNKLSQNTPFDTNRNLRD